MLVKGYKWSGGFMKKNILIVDDESIITSTVMQYFSSEGYNVVATNSPEAVISLINLERFDVVITDLNMHPLNGIDIVKHLRKLNFKGKTFVISAYYRDHEKELNTLKVDGIMGKPFKLEELNNRIKQLTE